MLHIKVPQSAQDHFWEEPPADSWEFWSFRSQPQCQIGDGLCFWMGGKAVATAVVAKIEKPGQSSCQTTGRFKGGWKVFWRPDSFIDLRRERTDAD